ncbi:MAG TPA: GNAT family N-acetyltransferase [Verrucomicrobiae bacterium]|nr:GNAT family N-acetyltransferase [Verrucomicrobiae bacterium]
MIMIRKAVPADCGSIYEAHTRAIRELCSVDYDQTQIEAWAGPRRATDYLKPISWGRLFVAEVDSKVVGFSEYDNKTRELKAVYVNPDYARQGIGKALFKYACDEARAEGLDALWLDASLTAVPFYLAMQCRRQQGTTHRLMSGIELLCVRMTINLREGEPEFAG